MKRLLKAASILTCLVLISSSAYSQLSQTYTLVNKSGMVITSVSYSPASQNVWSDNISTVDKLKNKEGFQYGFDVDPKNCTYDIKFKCDDGKEYIMKNVNLCTPGIITLTRE